jgi:hypothetical protein
MMRPLSFLTPSDGVHMHLREDADPFVVFFLDQVAPQNAHARAHRRDTELQEFRYGGGVHPPRGHQRNVPERSAQVLDERIPEIVCGEQLDHVGPDLPGVSHLGGRHGAGDGHHARRFVSATTASSVSGLMMYAAPASCAARTSSDVSTVPAPIGSGRRGLDEGGDPSRVFTHGVGRRVVERALQQRDARFGAGERGLNQDLRPNAAPDDHQPIPLDQG